MHAYLVTDATIMIYVIHNLYHFIVLCVTSLKIFFSFYPV